MFECQFAQVIIFSWFTYASMRTRVLEELDAVSIVLHPDGPRADLQTVAPCKGSRCNAQAM